MQQKSLSTRPVAVPTQQKIIMAKAGKICIFMWYTFLVSSGCPPMLTLLFLPSFYFSCPKCSLWLLPQSKSLYIFLVSSMILLFNRTSYPLTHKFTTNIWTLKLPHSYISVQMLLIVSFSTSSSYPNQTSLNLDSIFSVSFTLSKIKLLCS